MSNLGQPGVSRLQGKISLEGYTPAKMAAGAAAPKSPSIVNSLPARWQQDYLSLEGYTVSNLGLQPGVSRLQGKISLEGYTPAKMAAGAAAPKAHAILLHRQRRSKVAQVASPLWGRGMFFCSHHTLQGVVLVSFLSDIGSLEEQKCRLKTAFLHISAQPYIYIFCFTTTLHTSPCNPTQ